MFMHTILTGQSNFNTLRSTNNEKWFLSKSAADLLRCLVCKVTDRTLASIQHMKKMTSKSVFLPL